MPLIAARGLTRTYAARRRRPGLSGALRDLWDPVVQVVTALDGVDLEVEPGEVLGLIGPNGAGKSTLVKCLVGLLKPTAGSVRVMGLDPWAERRALVREVGVVFGQRSQLWWDLGVREALTLLAALHEVPEARVRHRLAALDAVLELAPLMDRPVRELSLGQRVRADLAASLLHEPPLLVLDEPTIGLDVDVKARVRALVRHAAEAGTTVLLTSHDLADLARTVDRVAVLAQGQVRGVEALEALVERLGGARCVRVRVEDGGQATAALQAALERAVYVHAGALDVPVHTGERVGDVIRRVVHAVEPLDLTVVEPDAADVLARLYGDLT